MKIQKGSQKVQSPFTSIIRFDVILFTSFTHRISEILTTIFFSISVFRYIAKKLSESNVFFESLYSIFNIAFDNKIFHIFSFSFILIYFLTEIRFFIFESEMIEMNKKNMTISAYSVLTIFATAMVFAVMKVFFEV